MLTKRQIEILRLMRDQDEELIYERGQGYVDVERVSGRTVFGLLRACAIRADSFNKVGGCERYSINETGLELLKKYDATNSRAG